MPTQSELHFRFDIPDGPRMDVVRFELSEGVSQPFHLELELSSFDDAIDPNALLDRDATFTIERHGMAERNVVGIVTAFQADATGFHRSRYRATVESPLARLGLRHNSRIFQQVSATAILATLLKEHRLAGSRTQYARNHEAREYCVQYRQSDAAFFHRLATEEGIVHWHEIDADHCRLVLSDCIDAAPILDGSVVYQPKPAGDAPGPYLWHFAYRRYPSCPSAGFELLRGGRIDGPDANTLDRAERHNWQALHFAAGQRGYIDLNHPEHLIRVLSDADFPAELGWRKVDEGHAINADDGIADATLVRGVLELADVNQNGTTTAEEVDAYLTSRAGQSLRIAMRHWVGKHPSEWDARTLEQRYRREREPGGALHDAVAWERFGEHARKLCFQDSAGFAPVPLWHFHPLQFIRQMRGCGWLSKDELARLYPDSQYPRAALTAEGRGRTPTTIREEYRPHINKVIRKYVVNTPPRMAHFFGQGAVESMLLSLMIEGSANYSRNSCTPSSMSSLIEANPVHLAPRDATRGCIVTPIRKGKQYPSIVYEAHGRESNVLIEDWESGLKPLPEVRNGRYVLQGRALVDSGHVEEYRYEWQDGEYKVLSRTCLETLPSGQVRRISCKR